MRKGSIALAFESIAFQNGKLFSDLTQHISAIRGFGEKLEGDLKFFGSDEILAIRDIIRKSTGITFNILNGQSTGPAMMPPKLNSNHVFYGEDLKDILKSFNLDFVVYTKKILDAMGKKALKGTIDLKNSKVSGIFEKLVVDLFIPRSFFDTHSPYLAEEVAAIILHEVGHAFTFMEFVNRSVSTNQVLAGITRACDKTVTADKREVAFVRAADLMKMTKSQRDALTKSTTATEASVIILDAAVQLSISELGVSIYDVNSAEMLADQFATRHGAGRALVTGLDRFMTTGVWRQRTTGDWIVMAIGIVLTIVTLITLTVFTHGLIWLLILYSSMTPDKKAEIYDNDKSRFLRIKMQNIERLKNPRIAMHEKETLIASNETIDKVSAYYEDNIPFIHTVSMYLRPSFRNAHKYELLQKDLERLGSSDLFHHAAKLSLL